MTRVGLYLRLGTQLTVGEMDEELPGKFMFWTMPVLILNDQPASGIVSQNQDSG